MGRRSNFKRRKNDKYLTPYKAVLPLLPFLEPNTRFVEPCAGDGRLIRWLERHGHSCVGAMDVDPQCLFIPVGDALAGHNFPFFADAVITNPPWTRALLHPMIEMFQRYAPTWLLFDAAWKHTGQAIPYLKHCSHIVNVGRVRWIDGTKQDGKDDSCWYKFDINHADGPHYYSEGK